MGKIESIFKTRKRNNQKVNIAYITPEYPFAGLTIPLCTMLSENNVQLIEIGVPFSDPLADGPVIQHSSYEALKKKVNINKIFSFIKVVKRQADCAIVLMTYLNPVLSYGIENFVKSSLDSGVDGVIIPDLPVDEIEFLKPVFENAGLDLILLAAPTSPVSRLEIIASNSRGFIYCVSVTGVTGIRKADYINQETISFLKQIKSLSSTPVAVGFGLSEADQLKKLAPFTDGFIIGSALIKAMENTKDNAEALDKARKFIQQVYSD